MIPSVSETRVSRQESCPIVFLLKCSKRPDRSPISISKPRARLSICGLRPPLVLRMALYRAIRLLCLVGDDAPLFRNSIYAAGREESRLRKRGSGSPYTQSIRSAYARLPPCPRSGAHLRPWNRPRATDANRMFCEAAGTACYSLISTQKLSQFDSCQSVHMKHHLLRNRVADLPSINAGPTDS